MKLLLDGYWWFEGPPSGRLVQRELYWAWRREFPKDEIIVATPRRSLLHNTPPAGLRVERSRLPNQMLVNALELPVIARRLGGVDAVLTHNFATPHRSSGVFLHDVLFQTNPEWFTRTERAYFSLMPLLARRASVVFTSSFSERSRIMRQNAHLKSVIATGLGLSSDLINAKPQCPASLHLRHGEFLLSVGRLNARKNLMQSLDGALSSGLLSQLSPLVVVGEASGLAIKLSHAARDAEADGRIIFLGRASDGELRWLYENCAVMLFLSLDEGFGLPPLEASSFGARVVASDIPVMHEVLPPGSMFVDPRNTSKIAAAIVRSWGAGRRTFIPRVSTKSDPTWANAVTKIRSELMPVSPQSKSRSRSAR
jgi:glycosyltransferase involved in cell wall biosynthesis